MIYFQNWHFFLIIPIHQPYFTVIWWIYIVCEHTYWCSPSSETPCLTDSFNPSQRPPFGLPPSPINSLAGQFPRLPPSHIKSLEGQLSFPWPSYSFRQIKTRGRPKSSSQRPVSSFWAIQGAEKPFRRPARQPSFGLQSWQLRKITVLLLNRHSLYQLQ